MYAVIQTGGKQYGIQTGTIVQVEKLPGDVGSSVQFSEVLLASKAQGDQPQLWLGKPLLSGAKVEGQIVGQGRGDKVMIVKMKRRKQYRRTQGHRQFYTQVLITSVENGAGEKTALSADEVKTQLSKFTSQLKAKGPASSTPNKAPWNMGMNNLGAGLLSEKKAAAPKKAAATKKAEATEAPAKKKTTKKKET